VRGGGRGVAILPGDGLMGAVAARPPIELGFWSLGRRVGLVEWRRDGAEAGGWRGGGIMSEDGEAGGDRVGEAYGGACKEEDEAMVR
jgi:hypothetical protein